MLTCWKQFSPRSPRGSLRKQGKPGGGLRARRLDVVFFLVGILLYTTSFFILPLAGSASGLYHTVARSLAHKCAEQIGFRPHLFFFVRIWTFEAAFFGHEQARL
jgi:hypothetical protein